MSQDFPVNPDSDAHMTEPPIGAVLAQDFPVIPDSDSHMTEPSRWKQNHGNLLLCFAAFILMVGACMLFYEQNLSFDKPRFPDSGNIDPVNPLAGDGSLGVATIRITGAATDKGTMKMAIYGSEATFSNPLNAVFATSETITGGEVFVPVSMNVLPENIAITVFHDENDDSILNKNTIGFPSERYGYSRNARGLTGPPTWNQTVIPRPLPNTTIEVFVR